MPGRHRRQSWEERSWLRDHNCPPISSAERPQDAKKPHVVITERMEKSADAYNVTSVPFPYTSREVFEGAMRMPLVRGRRDASSPLRFLSTRRGAMSSSSSSSSQHRALLRRTSLSPFLVAPRQGRETNTDASFRNLTRKKVLKKAGAMIDPIKYAKPVEKQPQPGGGRGGGGGGRGGRGSGAGGGGGAHDKKEGGGGKKAGGRAAGGGGKQQK